MRLLGADWGEVTRETGRSAYAPLVHARSPFEVEWRMVGGDEWIPASPHEFGEAVCDFIVRASRPHVQSAGDRFTVCGMVNGFTSVWMLDMPERVIAGNGEEILRVPGVAWQQGFGQVLSEPGDFQCEGEGFSVMNAGASQVALLPVARCEVGVMARRLGAWAVKTGRLPDEEVEQLKREIASCQV